MKKELFKPEVEELLNQLEKFSTENVGVCKTECRNAYSICLDAGKDATDCKSTFLTCIDKCLSAGLNDSDIKKAREILSELNTKL